MIKKFKRFFRRLYFKILILNRKASYQNSKITPSDKVASSIIKALINHEDSQFQIAPLSGKKYIKNERLGVFAVLYKETVSITNHVYHYDVYISRKNWERIIRMYDEKVESIRLSFENDIMSQIQFSLETFNKNIRKNR